MKTCNKDFIKEKELPKGDALSLPKGWEVKKLIDIAEVSTGKWNANHANKTGKYRFYTCAYKHGMCDTKRFSGKTLILPGNGVNVGEVFYYEGEFDAYQRTYVIFNINISPKYLHYHMRLFWKELGTKLQYGSATNFIKIGNFENYSVEHPPLPEQKRIVASLDQAFTAIDQAKANTEKNLGNARELFQSKLQETFANGKLKIDSGEWEEKKLNEIGIAQTGTTPKTSDKNNYGDFISFVKPADIDFEGDGKIRYDNVGLSKQGLKTGRKMLRGSILMVCIGASIGKVGFSDRDVSCNQQINSITTKEKFNSKFVYYALSTADFLKQVILNSAQATLPIINKGKWENLTVYYPKTTKEQKQIVKKLDAVSTETKKLEAIYQQKINCLDELKKSILQKAFNGEL